MKKQTISASAVATPYYYEAPDQKKYVKYIICSVLLLVMSIFVSSCNRTQNAKLVDHNYNIPIVAEYVPADKTVGDTVYVMACRDGSYPCCDSADAYYKAVLLP